MTKLSIWNLDISIHALTFALTVLQMQAQRMNSILARDVFHIYMHSGLLLLPSSSALMNKKHLSELFAKLHEMCCARAYFNTASLVCPQCNMQLSNEFLLKSTCNCEKADNQSISQHSVQVTKIIISHHSVWVTKISISKHSVQVTKSCLLRCMVGQEPTEFDATRGQVLANITELVVRQLEQKWAMSQARNSSVQLMRSLACYDEAFLFLDTSRQGDWRVLHMNKAASKLLGKRGSAKRASEHGGGGRGLSNSINRWTCA